MRRWLWVVAAGVVAAGVVAARTLPPSPSASHHGEQAWDEGEVDLFFRHTRKHARPMFYINCGYRDLCYCYSKVTRHHYCCSCDVGACFPARAAVATPAGPAPMASLATGDTVLAVEEGGAVVSTTVIGFLDRRPREAALYMTLHTDAGHNVTLSPNHVLFRAHPNTSQPLSVFGSQVRVGDVVFTANSTALRPARVLAVHHHVLRGAYVPLTKEGTLLVDNVWVSCYASYRHDLAHAFVAPARAWPLVLHLRPGLLSRLWSPLVSVARFLHSGYFLRSLLSGDETDKCQDVWTGEEGGRCEDGARNEGRIMEQAEGEAYYVSAVKMIGWLLYREERAAPQVVQVRPRVLEGGLFTLLAPPGLGGRLGWLAALLPRSW